MQIFSVLVWFVTGALLAWTLLIVPATFSFMTVLAFALWLALALYAVEKRFYPKLQIPWPLPVALLVATALLMLLPRQHFPDTASVWLPLHMLFALSCYALFTLAVVHGWLLVQREQQIRHPSAHHNTKNTTDTTLPLLTLERLMFNFVAAGFVLLSITILSGYVWHWAHKTVFAVLSWLVFGVLLWGRYRLGWRGRTAVRWVYVGAIFLLLSYIGSHFVLEVILQH